MLCELDLGFGFLIIELVLHLVLLALADDITVGSLGLVANIRQLFKFQFLPLVHDFKLTVYNPNVL